MSHGNIQTEILEHLQVDTMFSMESAKQDWSRGSCLLCYHTQQADYSGAISSSWQMVHTIWTACMVAGQLPEYWWILMLPLDLMRAKLLLLSMLARAQELRFHMQINAHAQTSQSVCQT